MEGDSKPQSWWFGNSGAVIAEIDGNKIFYISHTKRFGDRLQLNNQAGSLTIKNMRTKHSGLYDLLMYHKTGTSYMTFSVTVYGEDTFIRLFE